MPSAIADKFLALAAKKFGEYNSGRKDRCILRRLQLKKVVLNACALKRRSAAAGPEKPAVREARLAAYEACADSCFGEESAGDSACLATSDVAAALCSCHGSDGDTQVPPKRRKCLAMSQLKDTPKQSSCDSGQPGASVVCLGVRHAGDETGDDSHHFCPSDAGDNGEYPVQGAPFPSWLDVNKLAAGEPVVEPDLAFLDDDQP